MAQDSQLSHVDPMDSPGIIIRVCFHFSARQLQQTLRTVCSHHRPFPGGQLRATMRMSALHGHRCCYTRHRHRWERARFQLFYFKSFSGTRSTWYGMKHDMNSCLAIVLNTVLVKLIEHVLDSTSCYTVDACMK